MLRLLINIPLTHHAILLVLAIVLRIPSLSIFPLSDQEALHFLCANKMTEGGTLYKDIYFAGPPISIWIIYVFQKIFGSSYILMIRIGSIFYLYFSAALFNAALWHFKAIKKYPLLPSIIYISLGSVPWFSQSFYPSFLALVPFTIAFFNIVQLKESPRIPSHTLFKMGIWMAILILIAYKLVFLVIGMILTYFVVHRPKLTELLAMICGLLFGITIVCLIFYLKESLMSFWEVGVLFYLDRFELLKSLYFYDPWRNLQTLVISWGSALLLMFFAILHFRFKYFSYVVKIRSLEAMMMIWLLFGLSMIILKFQRLELADAIPIIPPLAFYVSKSFDLPGIFRFRFPIIASLLLIPIIQYINYMRIGPDHIYTQRNQEYSWLLPTHLIHSGIPSDIESLLQKREKEASLWILDYQPCWYYLLHKTYPNKYVDFRILLSKYELFSPLNPHALLSGRIEDKELFLCLKDAMPTYIIDPEHRFPILKKRFPLLLHHFRLNEDVSLPLYEHSSSVSRRTSAADPSEF